MALLEEIHAALYAQAKRRLDDNIKIGITDGTWVEEILIGRAC